MDMTGSGNSQELVLRLDGMMMRGDRIGGFDVLQRDSLLCAEGITFTDDISPWSITIKIK